MAAENSANEYFVIRGIPKQLRTADLRHFFSDALEAAIFQTFHFKHRPEIDAYKGPDIRVEGNERQNLNGPGCCCVVAVLSASGQDFLEEYQGVQWFDRGGNVLEASIWIEPVFSDPLNAYSEAVRKILVKGDSGVPAALSTNTPSCISALRTLSELRPPSGLPQGNVGTPQKTIMKMIQESKKTSIWQCPDGLWNSCNPWCQEKLVSTSTQNTINPPERYPHSYKFTRAR
eukprot:m.242250 g.242250  ORF g.242250 m.242250 type:complete len:231 (+) comp16090_c0_seq20:119-811(+)